MAGEPVVVPTIVVVNDDTQYLDLMTELLTEEGYGVIVCKETQNAYSAIRQARPAVVILDIRLEHPESGWKLLDMLRLALETRRLPVVVCSADGPFLRAKERQLREKGCEVLEKPFDLDELLLKVEAARATGRAQRNG
jgi:DNA-binding NtrC family response regulator